MSFDLRKYATTMKTSIILFALCGTLVCYSQSKKKLTKPALQVADSLYAAGQFAGAVPLYEEQLKENAHKHDAPMRNKLGLCYLGLKNYALAARTFEEVYRINPRQPGIFLNRAKAYSGAGEMALCVQMLDSALHVGRFANFDLLENDPAFENLRHDSRYAPVHDRVYAAAYPCANLHEARQFDFWLGDWDVYQTADLTIKTGFNRITKQAGGCIILESWESVSPHRGMSLNYYDPVSLTWKQKWAGSSQDITEFGEGRLEGNTMKFTWQSLNPDGTSSPGRLTFTNLAPGKVRQHSEVSSDGGATWQTVYDFTYIRRGGF